MSLMNKIFGPRAPVLAYLPESNQVVVSCPHCFKTHVHTPEAGTRVPHCNENWPPYIITYPQLKVVPPAPVQAPPADP